MFWWDHTNVVAEYTVSADDPNGPTHVGAHHQLDRLAAVQPQRPLDRLRPDGMLYISTGDGGYANDWGIGHNVTEGNGQDLRPT
jgi:hypothetical protein